jgi:hypothetical protein
MRLLPSAFEMKEKKNGHKTRKPGGRERLGAVPDSGF